MPEPEDTKYYTKREVEFQPVALHTLVQFLQPNS